MKLIKSLLSTLGAALFCTLAMGGTAQATSFSITNAIFHPGVGYGVDASEANGSATLLDVTFSTLSFGGQSFNLLPIAGSNSISFKVGSITFAEPNDIQGILPSETDDLGVSIDLTFAAPGVGVQSVTATGTAVPGSIQDNAMDLTIVWTPINVTFGDNGLYQISLDSVAFSKDSTLDQYVTIKLLSDDIPTDVPEPGSMALLGLGLLGIVKLRRKNRA